MIFSTRLLTPEGPMAQEEVERLHLPGEDGELDVLAHHMPLIVSLRPGVVSFHKKDTKGIEDRHFFIWGGLADIHLEETRILALRAILLFDLDQVDLEKKLHKLSNAVEKNEKIQEKIHLVQAQLDALERYRYVQFHLLSGASP